MRDYSMKNHSVLLWLIPLILLLVLVPFLVPSALPAAGAEEESSLPVMEPVVLANPDPGPVPLNEKGIPVYSAHPDGVLSDPPGYLDGTISVRTEERVLKNKDGKNTKVLFTWIQIADPTQLRTASCAPYPSQSENWGDRLATREHAVFAMNGDWFVGRREGVVWRNGALLREATYLNGNGYDALIVDTDGDFHVLIHPELSELEAFEGRIMHSFVFGPALVVDGELQVYDNNNYGTGAGMGLHKMTQRQVICQLDHLSYLVISTEGPEQTPGGGFTASEIAKIAYDCGAKQAYNLDGGASTWTIVAQGEDAKPTRINNLRGKKRPITDIIYFVTAEPAPEPAEEAPAQ